MSLHGKEREKKKTFAHFYFIDHCVTGHLTHYLKGYPLIYSSSLFLFDFLSSAKNKIRFCPHIYTLRLPDLHCYSKTRTSLKHSIHMIIIDLEKLIS